ncbi:MAG TPA: hypothetical protein VIK06_07130 [Candidatus Limnocylindrales bacterium]
MTQRSAFAAAFLSFVMPGLGHAYGRAYVRATGFAVVPMVGLGLVGGLLLRFGPRDF